MPIDDVARRRVAKRFNERLKLTATFLNNSGIATLVGGFVLPLAGASERAGSTRWIWLAVPVLLHASGQVVLTFLRSEE